MGLVLLDTGVFFWGLAFLQREVHGIQGLVLPGREVPTTLFWTDIIEGDPCLIFLHSESLLWTLI